MTTQLRGFLTNSKCLASVLSYTIHLFGVKWVVFSSTVSWSRDRQVKNNNVTKRQRPELRNVKKKKAQTEEELKRLREESIWRGVDAHNSKGLFKHSLWTFKKGTEQRRRAGVTITANCFLLAREANKGSTRRSWYFSRSGRSHYAAIQHRSERWNQWCVRTEAVKDGVS